MLNTLAFPFKPWPPSWKQGQAPGARPRPSRRPRTQPPPCSINPLESVCHFRRCVPRGTGFGAGVVDRDSKSPVWLCLWSVSLEDTPHPFMFSRDTDSGRFGGGQAGCRPSQSSRPSGAVLPCSVACASAAKAG